MKKSILVFVAIYFSCFSIVAIAKEFSSSDPDSLYAQVGVLQEKKQNEKAIEILKTLEINKKWMMNRENSRKTYNSLGFSYYLTNKFYESANNYAKAIELAIELQDTTKLISSQASLGMAYRQIGFYSKSLEANQQALDLALKQKNIDVAIGILNTIGILYQNLKQWDKSIEKLEIALDLSESLSDTLMVSYIYSNLAISHKEKGQIDKSLDYNLKSLEIKDNLGLDQKEKVKVLNNIGESYLIMDSLELAEKYLQLSNELYENLEDKKGLIGSFNNLAELAIKKSEFQLAAIYLEKAENLLIDNFVKNLNLQNLEVKVDFLEKVGRYSEALKVQKELTKLREEIFQAEQLQVQQVEANYALREKELEGLALQRVAEFAKINSRKNIQLIIVLFVILGLAAFVILLFGRLNKRLTLSNKIIQAQKLDLKHSTYNTLMRIQGLLRLTSSNISDELSRERLLQAEAAIISAASLQQFTYGIENDGEVEMGRFLEELLNRLEQTLNIYEESFVSYQVEIEHEVVLPVTMVLNCGLIVAEIVANALKYAFTPAMSDAKITLNLKKSGQNLLLQVRDNGIGMEDNFEKNGVGKGLIDKLARYIKAEVSVLNDNGTVYTIKLRTNYD